MTLKQILDRIWVSHVQCGRKWNQLPTLVLVHPVHKPVLLGELGKNTKFNDTASITIDLITGELSVFGIKVVFTMHIKEDDFKCYVS